MLSPWIFFLDHVKIMPTHTLIGIFHFRFSHRERKIRTTSAKHELGKSSPGDQAKHASPCLTKRSVIRVLYRWPSHFHPPCFSFRRAVDDIMMSHHSKDGTSTRIRRQHDVVAPLTETDRKKHCKVPKRRNFNNNEKHATLVLGS